jgi:MFS family permease
VALAWASSNCIAYTLVGRLSDIFGRRYFIIGSNIFGLIGLTIAASAQTANTLIAGNVFNGIATTGQNSFPIVIGELVPNNARGRLIGLILLLLVPFSAFGPVIMRAFFTHTALKWRWGISYQYLYDQCQHSVVPHLLLPA